MADPNPKDTRPAFVPVQPAGMPPLTPEQIEAQRREYDELVRIRDDKLAHEAKPAAQPFGYHAPGAPVPPVAPYRPGEPADQPVGIGPQSSHDNPNESPTGPVEDKPTEAQQRAIDEAVANQKREADLRDKTASTHADLAKEQKAIDDKAAADKQAAAEKTAVADTQAAADKANADRLASDNRKQPSNK